MVFLFLFLGGWGINYKDGKRVYNNGSKIMIIKYLNSFFLINFAFLLKKYIIFFLEILYFIVISCKK